MSLEFHEGEASAAVIKHVCLLEETMKQAERCDA
jgi:hypothetical protein